MIRSGVYYMLIEGECFCAAVKYSITRPLRDARSCHCSRCRKAFSSQASAYALVDTEAFKWTAGEEFLTTYATGNGFGLQFCRRCGSTLCGVFNGDIHGVSLGCVNGDPNVDIGRHIFVGSKAAWERIPDGVPQFDESAPNDAWQPTQV